MLTEQILPLQLGNPKYSDSHVVQPNPIWFGGQTENKNRCKGKNRVFCKTYQFQRQN